MQGKQTFSYFTSLLIGAFLTQVKQFLLQVGAYATTGLPDWLYRGYTGHEHLDQFGLINMNGRLYDPVLGRMLSPDNYVQEPGMTQSYNRYTYAMNNPLVYTDPDGNFWHIVIGAAIGGVINWGVHGFKWNQQGLLAFGIGAAAGAVTAATGGAASVYASTGSLSGAFSATAVASATTGAAGGAVAGLAGSALGSPILGIGNNLAFGDPYSPERFGLDLLISTVTGGVAGGIAAKFKGLPFLNGDPDGPGLFPKFGLGEYRKIDGVWKFAYNSGGDLTYRGIAEAGSNVFGGSAWGYNPGDVVGRNTRLFLNQFNSVESLIESASSSFGEQVLKRGEIQGFVRGNGPEIFKSISRDGQKLSSGAYRLPSGTFIRAYNANSGNFTIQINTSLQIYKIRIIP